MGVSSEMLQIEYLNEYISGQLGVINMLFNKLRCRWEAFSGVCRKLGQRCTWAWLSLNTTFPSAAPQPSEMWCRATALKPFPLSEICVPSVWLIHYLSICSHLKQTWKKKRKAKDVYGPLGWRNTGWCHWGEVLHDDLFRILLTFPSLKGSAHLRVRDKGSAAYD